MTVVIDTNSVLPMLGRRHSFAVILDAFIDGEFDWAVSNEILSEYEEVAVERMGRARFERFASILELGGQLHGTLHRVAPSFRFHLITTDPDDDKFADCAIAAEADFIITSDHHFAALGSSTLPCCYPIEIIQLPAQQIGRAHV